KFRAQSATARREWALATGYWGAYLQSPAATAAAERVAALDELAQVLVRQCAWHQARDRLNERLGLADGVSARVMRATVQVRLREWALARDDFSHLLRVAPDNEDAKALLPCWERVERAMTELTSRDAAVEAAPTLLGPRMDRALTAMQAGLWQN